MSTGSASGRSGTSASARTSCCSGDCSHRGRMPSPAAAASARRLSSMSSHMWQSRDGEIEASDETQSSHASADNCSTEADRGLPSRIFWSAMAILALKAKRRRSFSSRSVVLPGSLTHYYMSFCRYTACGKTKHVHPERCAHPERVVAVQSRSGLCASCTFCPSQASIVSLA